MGGLRERVQGAGSDVALGKAADQVLALGLNVVLMRLLSPAPFGTIALAAIVLGVLRPVTALGLPDAIRQFEDLAPEEIDTAFWLIAGAGLAAALFTGGVAGLLETFFDEPGLGPVLTVMAATLAIQPLAAVPKALFERDLRFGPVVLAEVSATLVSGGMAVSLAAAGAGVWSLVAKALVRPLVEGAALLKKSRWSPGQTATRRSAGRLLEYGRPLSQLGVLTFLNRKADDFLVGKFLGTEALGLYDRSYTLMLRPLSAPTTIVTRVLFPTGSRLQGTPDRARRAYREAIEVLAFFVLPLLGFVFGAAPVLVPTMFGPQWAEMVPLVSILCLAAVPQVVIKPLGVVYKAEGRTRLFFRWNLVVTLVTVGAFGIGTWLGSVEAVATAYAVSVYLLAYPQIRIPASLIEIDMRRLLRGAWGPLIAAAASSGIVRAGVHFTDRGEGSAWVFVGLAFAATGILYSTFVLLLSRGTFEKGMDILGGLMARIATASRRVM